MSAEASPSHLQRGSCRQRILLRVQRLQPCGDVGVHEICDVPALQDLGHDVVAPRRVLQAVALAQVRAVHARAALLLLHGTHGSMVWVWLSRKDSRIQVFRA